MPRRWRSVDWYPQPKAGSHPPRTASGCPREFHGNRCIYTVVSPRARGLTVGINVNPDKRCNFDCIYCEVQRGLERFTFRDEIWARLNPSLRIP